MSVLPLAHSLFGKLFIFLDQFTQRTELYVCSYYMLQVFETVITPYTEAAYDWSVSSNGLLFTVFGVISLLTQILVLFKRRIADQTLVLAGLIIQVGQITSDIMIA